MTIGLGAYLGAVLLSSSIQPPVSRVDTTIFRDGEREIEVKYHFTPDSVEFSSRLPIGWSFTVKIDGDHNGIWGAGPAKVISVRPTQDRGFGQDQNGTFCAQYILSSSAEDPSETYSNSNCNGYPSSGTVQVGQMDKQRLRATYTLKVPLADVFGSQPNAHLQVCVWDTQRNICQFTPAKPFILERPRANKREKG